MNWYKEYRKEWKEIIETVASEAGRTEQMVEKDAIQSMLLYDLSQEQKLLVFKGGTSLSKAYGLIDRFSEDIDLSAIRKLTESEKRLVKQSILSVAEQTGLTLSNPGNVFSRYSYNKYVFRYQSLFAEHELEIIVETSFYQPVYPVEQHEVNSFIGAFCRNRDLILPVPFDASEFYMNVQALERTFVDKVFAVCDYYLQDMQNRDSRHLYDIAKILPDIELSSELRILAARVRNDRMCSENNPSAQPVYDIPAMLREITGSRFYEMDYKNITQKLLYDEMSYEDAVKNGIAVVAEADVF